MTRLDMLVLIVKTKKQGIPEIWGENNHDNYILVAFIPQKMLC